MIIIFWNIQRLGQKGRRGQLKDIMLKYKIDVICLQEIIKRDFSIFELRELGNNQPFSWNWVPAEEHSGGILTGVRQGNLDVEAMTCGEFYARMEITNQKDGFRWELINVYGPVQIERNGLFLQELYRKIEETRLPIMMGGDFNLIRFAHEKPTDNVNLPWMEIFNAFLNDLAIIEVHRGGSRYTWTNKQSNPIMSNLDRIFISMDWEEKYPKVTARSILRIGSDHTPIVVDSGEDRIERSYIFIFEMAWMAQEGFKQMIIDRWPERKDERILDYWKQCTIELRKFCRGWCRNNDNAIKKEKQALKDRLSELDGKGDTTCLNEVEWQEIYNLEVRMEQIYTYEEIRWQRRGGETWLLKGDTNTSYFHKIANGRRKCEITKLENEDRILIDQKEIKMHIEGYYKNLFGNEIDSEIKL